MKHKFLFGSGILLIVASVLQAAPTIDIGTIYMLANDSNAVVPLRVTGGDAVEGVNLYIQVADGGADNGGTATKPRITEIDITSIRTVFDGNNTGPGFDVMSNGMMWAAVTATQEGTVNASGVLAFLTFDATGTSVSDTYPLSLQNVAGWLTTDFADIPAAINDGNIIIVNDYIDLYWRKDAAGNWMEAGWSNTPSGTPPSAPSYPNYVVNAHVDVSQTVDVADWQDSNTLEISGGGRVNIGSAGFLAVTNAVTVNASGTLALVTGADLSASAINLSGGTITGSGTAIVNPTVNLAGGILDAPVASDTLTVTNPLGGTGGLTKTGDGVVILEDNATYEGSTIIIAGLLDLEGVSSSLGDISGEGSLCVGVSSSATLTATSISVDTLTIGSLPSTGSGSAANNTSAVPEPSTIILLSIVGMSLGFYGFQSRRSSIFD